MFTKYTNGLISSLLIAAFGVFSFGICTPAHAQQVRMSLYPPIVEAMMKPGKSILIGFTLENKGDPSAFVFNLQGFRPRGERGEYILEQTETSPIQFSLENADLKLQQPFFLPGSKSKQAVLRVIVDEGVPEGDYYYMLQAETIPSAIVGGQSAGSARATIAAPLLITVSKTGQTQIQASISLFQISSVMALSLGNNYIRLIDASSPIEGLLIVHNKGRNLIKPSGSITQRAQKNSRSTSVVPQNILSNSQRLLKTDALPSTSSNSFRFSSSFWGKNTLTASLSFGDNSPQLISQIEYYAFPFSTVILTLFVCALCIGIVVVYTQVKRRRRGRSEDI